MSHCLGFLFHPSISQSWESWRRAVLRLITKFRSYSGPFTGLEVRSLNESGKLSNYSASGRRTEILLSDSDLSVISWRMGGCASSDRPLSEKRISRKDATPLSARPIKRMDSKSPEAEKDNRCTGDHDGPLPRRLNMNGATKVACLFTQQGRKGLNQDAMVVFEDFGAQKNTVFCGVFDGHGSNGHIVAHCVRDLLPLKLASNWQALSGDNGVEQYSNLSVGSEYFKDTVREVSLERSSDSSDVDYKVLSDWKESFLNAYLAMDKELLGTRSIDCFCSGTTAVTLVKQGKDVIIANVGDSRAILATKCSDGSVKPVQLTVDLKPNLPEEAERIKQCRGRVFALQDEPDVHRVWLPHDDSPGLAMARALGDSCLKSFGVIAVPEVTYHRLTERDRFIVLATDGVWDVLSNEEVVKIVSSVSAQSLAAKAVVEKAVKAWRSEYPCSQVDDCAVVCLFIQDTLSIYSDYASRKQSTLCSSSIKQYVSHNVSQNSKVKEMLALRSIQKKIQVSVCPDVKDSDSVSQDMSPSKGQPEVMSLSVDINDFKRSGTVVLRKVENGPGHQSPGHNQSADKLLFEECSSADSADDTHRSG